MPAGATMAVDLPTTWDAFERRLGRKLRINSAYYERKMQREGGLVIREISGNGRVDWSQVIADLGRVEEKSWLVSGAGTLRFLGDRNYRFWLGLLSQSEAGNHARVWLMYLGNAPVSFCFAMDYGACDMSCEPVRRNGAQFQHRLGSLSPHVPGRDRVWCDRPGQRRHGGFGLQEALGRRSLVRPEELARVSTRVLRQPARPGVTRLEAAAAHISREPPYWAT